jgi:hypothetical protein
MRQKSRRASAEASARRADEDLLSRRLRELGLPDIPPLEMHENRTVLVSQTKHGALRLHRGYAYASDRVLSAVVAYVSPTADPAEHKEAERVLEGFPVEDYVRAPRRPGRPRLRRGDRQSLARLEELHGEFNRRHFSGALGPIEFRVSGRMRTCLGELTIDVRTGRPTEIARTDGRKLGTRCCTRWCTSGRPSRDRKPITVPHFAARRERWGSSRWRAVPLT